VLWPELVGPTLTPNQGNPHRAPQRYRSPEAAKSHQSLAATRAGKANQAGQGGEAAHHRAAKRAKRLSRAQPTPHALTKHDQERTRQMTTTTHNLTGFRCDRTQVRGENGQHTHDRLTFQFGEGPMARTITYALRPSDGLHLVQGPRPGAEKPGIYGWLQAHSLVTSDVGRRLLAETANLGQQRLLGFNYFHEWSGDDVYITTRKVFKSCALVAYKASQAEFPHGDAYAAWSVLDAALGRPAAEHGKIQLAGCSVLLAPPLPPKPPTDVAVGGHGDHPATVVLLQQILATLLRIDANVASLARAEG
jgi:hypothetical protein